MRFKVIALNQSESQDTFARLRSNVRTGTGRQVQCFNCKEMGHFKRDCNNPRVVECFNCGELGHSSFECKHTSISRGPVVENETEQHSLGQNWNVRDRTGQNMETLYARVVGGVNSNKNEVTHEKNDKVGLEV